MTLWCCIGANNEAHSHQNCLLRCWGRIPKFENVSYFILFICRYCTTIILMIIAYIESLIYYNNNKSATNLGINVLRLLNLTSLILSFIVPLGIVFLNFVNAIIKHPSSIDRDIYVLFKLGLVDEIKVYIAFGYNIDFSNKDILLCIEKSFTESIKNNDFRVVKFWIDLAKCRHSDLQDTLYFKQKGIDAVLLLIQNIVQNGSQHLPDRSVLTQAVANENVAMIGYLLTEFGHIIDINRADNETLGYTPLIQAILTQNTEITNIFIERSDININICDTVQNQYPLMYALSQKNVTLTKQLLDICNKSGNRDTVLNLKDKMGQSSFVYSWKSVECIKLLVEFGFDIDEVDSNEISVLDRTVEVGDMNTFKYLLGNQVKRLTGDNNDNNNNNDSNINGIENISENERNLLGNHLHNTNLLNKAVTSKTLNILQYILDENICKDINKAIKIQTSFDRERETTTFIYAVESKDETMFDLVYKHQISQLEKRNNSYEIIQFLNIHEQDETGKTAWYFAAKQENVEIMKKIITLQLLLPSSLSVHDVDDKSRRHATTNSVFESVDFKQIFSDKQYVAEYTPILWCIRNKQKYLCSMLINNGVFDQLSLKKIINARDSTYNRYMYEVGDDGDIDTDDISDDIDSKESDIINVNVVEWCMKSKEIPVRDYAIFEAILKNKVEIVRELIENPNFDVKINKRNEFGKKGDETPLIVAAKNTRRDVFEVLISLCKDRLDFSIVDADGNTPLMILCMSLYTPREKRPDAVEMVELIIKNDLNIKDNIRLKNKNGNTALGIAIGCRFYGAIDVIMQYYKNTVNSNSNYNIRDIDTESKDEEFPKDVKHQRGEIYDWLLYSIKNNDFSRVEKIVNENNIDINDFIVANNGFLKCTPLVASIIFDSYDTVELLLNMGANVNIVDEMNLIAMDYVKIIFYEKENELTIEKFVNIIEKFDYVNDIDVDSKSKMIDKEHSIRAESEHTYTDDTVI